MQFALYAQIIGTKSTKPDIGAMAVSNNYFLCAAMPAILKIYLACAVVQALYYLVVFFRLNFVRPFRSVPELLPGVSVVICAKNEARNLLRNLKIVLIQQYKQFEVIVVNDQSTDNSIDVLVDFYIRNENLKIVNIYPGEKKTYAGKKYALLKGIEAASFKTIVVTDADCRPASTHWLSGMMNTYLQDTEIVLGYSPFEKRSGFLNKLIRYENFVSALQYFGFAKLGLPYMGVGRNLSYKKALFDSLNGFEKNKDLPTGDDDLFINVAANARNTEICMDKEAFTYTQPEETWQAWLNQKRRHLRAGFRYKFAHRVLLFLFALSGFAFYLLLPFVLLNAHSFKLAAWILIFLLLLKFVVTFRIFKKSGGEDLRLLSPALDVVYYVYLLIIFLLLLLKPKDSWKN
jgi:cellulose synthase/poly-beta-1,6-N-acetylglucosamine synthase-like glycosyltransferase